MEFLNRSRLPHFTPRLDLTAEELNQQADIITEAINELAGRLFIIKDMVSEENRGQYAEEPSYPILKEILNIWDDIEKAWQTLDKNKEECDNAVNTLTTSFIDLEKRLNTLDDAAARKSDLADMIQRLKWIKENCLPSISEEGTWLIGKQDTGIPVTGPQGPIGPQGIPGESGVYYGSDTPPENATVWIDPTGIPDKIATEEYVNEMLGVIENGSY